MNMNSKSIKPISPQVLFILITLAVKDRHGYEIMKQVKKDSDGKVSVGPGTLYGAIKRMLRDGWIMEAGERDRRKYYSLTKIGRKNLSAELQRYEETLAKAKKNNLLVNPEISKLAYSYV
jgi:DNA-binding PadR family transcriptional regulator